MTTSARSRYAGHRFPPEVIGHAIWLSFRFPLSLRMVEEMLTARDILVSHETVRQWGLKFGQGFANQSGTGGPLVRGAARLGRTLVRKSIAPPLPAPA